MINQLKPRDDLVRKERLGARFLLLFSSALNSNNVSLLTATPKVSSSFKLNQIFSEFSTRRFTYERFNFLIKIIYNKTSIK